jgi:hypothetical protein
MYGYIDQKVERLISNNVDATGNGNERGIYNKQRGECISMDIITKISHLIAIFLLASGINAIGAEYPVGSGNDDWWTAYPDQSPGAGGDVNHPSWVLDALKAKPVLIYVHKSCSYCAPQTLAIQNITEEFNGQITFFEIMGDGSDARSEEALQAYDPNGGVMYVPMTVIVTLATNPEGEVVPIWHSTEEVTGDAWVKNYVEDAIVQYDENSADWNP